MNPHYMCVTFTVNAVMSAIEGTQLLYSLHPHPALNPIMHLLPPNIMVSGQELIPGVLPPTDSTGKIAHDAMALIATNPRQQMILFFFK